MRVLLSQPLVHISQLAEVFFPLVFQKGFTLKKGVDFSDFLKLTAFASCFSVAAASSLG